MREVTLKRFFLEDVTAKALEEDVSGSVIHLDQISSTIQIEDMKGHFELHREHVIRPCDAALSETLSPKSLIAVAFALMASETFWWGDEVISEVLADWSAPEINYPLTAGTLRMHRGWLRGLAGAPERTPSAPRFTSRQIHLKKDESPHFGMLLDHLPLFRNPRSLFDLWPE